MTLDTTMLPVGPLAYRWIGDWAQVPDTETARQGWAHPGVAVTGAGDIVTVHPGEPRLLFFDTNGRLVRSVEMPATEGHGLCLVREGATDYLWVADSGSKRVGPPDYAPQGAGGQVLKLTLDGEVVIRFGQPDLPIYDTGKFSPTAVAVWEEGRGGDGTVWIADGYGTSTVHRYDRMGRYLSSINGGEGLAGAFKTPHGVAIDDRHGEPELYVADRTNHRLQVYSVDGRWKRVVGEEFLSSPSVFAFVDNFLVVGELRARLAVLDERDQFVGYLGENEAVCTEPGWPNAKDEVGGFVRTPRLVPGKFNSPHGLAADSTGNLYVAEWLIGGRYTKLERVQP